MAFLVAMSILWLVLTVIIARKAKACSRYLRSSGFTLIGIAGVWPAVRSALDDVAMWLFFGAPAGAAATAPATAPAHISMWHELSRMWFRGMDIAPIALIAIGLSLIARALKLRQPNPQPELESA